MATIYKVEVVSFWSNYTKEQLEKILQDAVNKIEEEKGNEIKITVQDRS
jgi:ABC-type glycerol-3-phosphate transport system substrate-binding protein